MWNFLFYFMLNRERDLGEIMKIIDLSYMITENMPVYPGTEQPEFDAGTTLEQDGFLEKKSFSIQKYPLLFQAYLPF